MTTPLRKIARQARREEFWPNIKDRCRCMFGKHTIKMGSAGRCIVCRKLVK